jgi:hypothetical protein
MSEIAEVLEKFRRGPEVLAVMLTGSAGPESDFATEPGKWNIRQILRHLVDAELVGAHRFRVMLAEDNPRITAWNQDLWAGHLDYAVRKPQESLETFRRIRADNYELFKNTPEAAFERTGVHDERGAITVKGLLAMYADHVEGHARAIQGIREEYKKFKAKR